MKKSEKNKNMFYPDTCMGNPCCFLLSEEGKEEDLMGMGVPMWALPLSLRPVSMNGWRLGIEYVDGEKRMHVTDESGKAEQRENCSDYIEKHKKRIMKDLTIWYESLEV